MIGDFHFLRPWWLVALVPAAALVLALRRRSDARLAWRNVVAPHLLPHLLSSAGGEGLRRRVGPLALLATGWLVATVAVAGPTWHRVTTPGAQDVATVAIVVKVTPSMAAQDVQPSRLERSVQKVHDLIGRRSGARVSLVAYAGTAHVVMPATTDGGIVDTFAAALDPKVMPTDGDAAADALRHADQTLADAGGGGSIVWVVDGVAPEQAAALAAWRRSSSTPVRVLVPLPDGPERDAVRSAVAAVDAGFVPVTPDAADVDALARAARYAAAPGPAAGDRWAESGYWLAPAVAALLLPFVRRGWMVSTAATR